MATCKRRTRRRRSCATWFETPSSPRQVKSLSSLYTYVDQYIHIPKMADEEVDWGVDEVLEANAVDAAIGTDDVLSLGGDEGSSSYPISSSGN